ncbi:MAG: hypothetical protein ACO1SV_16410 [Fimbriimonas sp.]
MRPLVIGSSARRKTGQVVMLLVGLGLAGLGIAVPHNADPVWCIPLGILFTLLALSGLFFVDELTVRPGGAWQRRRGFGPMAQTQHGHTPLTALVERMKGVRGPDDVTPDVHYHVVIRFPDAPDLMLWPDATLCTHLGIRPNAGKSEVAQTLNERLQSLRRG